METTMKLLDFDSLAAKGVRFSGTHLFRLINAGRFPKPLKIGKRNFWVETEIDKYIADRLAERDGAGKEPAHV
jgi:prophage regulatory protein